MGTVSGAAFDLREQFSNDNVSRSSSNRFQIEPSKSSFVTFFRRCSLSKLILWSLFVIFGCVALTLLIYLLLSKFAWSGDSRTTKMVSYDDIICENETMSMTKNDSSLLLLPDWLHPKHYDLKLTIGLTFNFLDLKFDGSVEILLYVNKPTRAIVFHARDLIINFDSIKVYSTNSINSPISISNYSLNDYSQTCILFLSTCLTPGTHYVLKIDHFEGLVHMDGKGLYLSSYRTSKNVTRCEKCLNFWERFQIRKTSKTNTSSLSLSIIVYEYCENKNIAKHQFCVLE